MKTTKAQAQEIYGEWQAVLRNHCGGTREENERMAYHCHNRLVEVVGKAIEASKDPSKSLLNQRNSWILDNLKALPERLAKWEERFAGHWEQKKKEENLPDTPDSQTAKIIRGLMIAAAVKAADNSDGKIIPFSAA